MKVRESQFELLRLVAMMMIVIVHFNGVAMEMFLPITTSKIPFSQIWGAEALEALAIIGVNLFVLISGFFGIRLKAKGLLRYVGWVLWYSVLIYLIVSCFYPELFRPDNTIYAVHGISHSTQWFVTDYFYLMVLSPIINGVMQRTTFKQHLWIALALFVVNCGLGWWGEMVFNKDGYTVYHMIFIYCLGWTLRELHDRYGHLRLSAVCVAVYLLMAAVVVLMMQSMSYFKVIAYNNPIIVIESIAFFWIFAQMRFTNLAINWAASTSFAVYLIHMHFSLWPHVLRPLLVDVYNTYSGTGYALIGGIIAIVLFWVCILIDKPREWLFAKILNGKTAAS